MRLVPCLLAFALFLSAGPASADKCSWHESMPAWAARNDDAQVIVAEVLTRDWRDYVGRKAHLVVQVREVIRGMPRVGDRLYVDAWVPRRAPRPGEIWILGYERGPLGLHRTAPCTEAGRKIVRGRAVGALPFESTVPLDELYRQLQQPSFRWSFNVAPVSVISLRMAIAETTWGQVGYGLGIYFLVVGIGFAFTGEARGA